MSLELVMLSIHLVLWHPFSFCLQSFPASESFPMSQLFASGGQSIGASASASVLPMNIQGWFPLGLLRYTWQIHLFAQLSRVLEVPHDQRAPDSEGHVSSFPSCPKGWKDQNGSTPALHPQPHCMPPLPRWETLSRWPQTGLEIFVPVNLCVGPHAGNIQRCERHQCRLEAACLAVVLTTCSL